MSSADKLIIETPEQTSIEFPLAGIGSRFLALAIDGLLRIAFIIVLVGIAGILGLIGLIKAAGTQWVVAILIVAYFFIELGYFAFFESVWNGQTPGKRWTHLRVIKDSGRPIGVPDAVLRNLMRTVDYLPSLYAAGVVSILISKQNKRLGDLVAGTVVVRENPLQGFASVWEGSPSAQAPALGHFPPLSVEELQLIETFLERRGSLDSDVRRAMSRQIAERISESRSIPPESRADSEKFLEAVAAQNRQSARFR
jgi:uncharacterized RDD family membrane protein YckC